MKFSQITGVVMDMDGVLWRGDVPLPGLHDLFDWLRESGTPFALATNNSTRTPAEYAAKLARMGVVDVPERNIVTSSTATATYLQARYPAGTHIYVFGMDALRTVVLSAGFEIAGDDEMPPVAVIGGDFEMTYTKLKRASLVLQAGAYFVSTNTDKTFPSPEGLIPGAGSMLAAIEAAAGRSPDVVIGKPNAPMFEAALKVTGTSAETTLMIGDRLETDILGAKNAGMKAALLFTGVNTPDDLTADAETVWPDVAYEGLPDLVRAWAGDDWVQARVKQQRSASKR